MQLELLDLFETPSPFIPTRSKLISIEPRGLNSPYCEAMISYLTRLANEHVVRPNTLVKEIVLPLTEIHLGTGSCSFNSTYSRTINAYAKYAKATCSAIENLTLRKNLHLLTFLPWSALLDPKGSGLLRKHVSVCRECISDLSTSKAGIYYPLLWYIRGVRICLKHKCFLIEACPNCGKKQNFVSHHAMLGYCTQCGGWMGSHREKTSHLSSHPAISAQDQFYAMALGQMIENNSTAGQIATHTRFVERLSAYSEVLTSGSLPAMEKLLGFKKNVLLNWHYKRCRPRIDLFLRLCFRLGKMPVQFLTEDISSDLELNINFSEKVDSTPRRKLTLKLQTATNTRLQEILDGNETPTQYEVAEMLQLPLRFLLHHFRKEMQSICKKRKHVIHCKSIQKRAIRVKRAKSLMERMLSERRAISKRKIDAELRIVGLTLADPQNRKAVKEVINESHNNNK